MKLTMTLLVIPTSWRFLAPTEKTSFGGLEPQQRFQQVIIAVDEHSIVRVRAAPVPKNARRRPVLRTDRSKIPVDQRLHYLFRLAQVLSRAGLIPGEFRKPEQSRRQ